MKGVILAGGTGSRLHPLTALVNKHLLPVGKHPMIHYAIQKLKQANITEQLIVMGQQSAGLYTQFFGNGEQWGINLTYKLQSQAGGIAEALAHAEGFIQPNEKFVVLLGDNLFSDSLHPFITQFKQQEKGASVVLKKVKDPRRYGVPEMKDEKIIGIEEKPAKPKSNYCVTGIYLYDSEVFEIIRQAKPSQRGELEITSINNTYAHRGDLSFHLLSGWWTDAGTFDSLYAANHYMLKQSGMD